MFCRKCGAPNDDNAFKCGSCGEVFQPVAQAMPMAPVSIPNYLVQSIMVTLFCCLPLGIPAIIYAAQVNGKLRSGDLAGATDFSRKAKMWSWIAFGAGLLVLLIYVAAIAVGVVSAGREAAVQIQTLPPPAMQ